jgi:hypothetical protein
MRAKVMAEQSPPPQARRALLSALGGALALLTLSGCEFVPSAPVASAPLPPTQTAQAEPERVQPQPRPVTAAPLPQGAPHRVAVLVPITGANAGVGQSIANAANLALLDTGGGRIRLTVYDTARGGAGAAAAQAIADGNRLFLGPLLAEDVRAATPAARRAGVPVVAFSNDTSVAASGVYLMGFTPGESVARVVDYVRSQGAVRFGALVPDGIYGRRASEAMIQSVRGGGGTLVATLPIGRGVAMKSAATRLGSLGGYDAVLMTLRIARDGRAGSPFPEGELRDPSGFPGLDGPFRFGADGVAERALEVREVTAGGSIVVSPAPRGF